MVIDNILSGNYLQERSKTKLFVATAPFPLLIVLTWLVAIALGHHLLLEFVSMGVISFLLMIPIVVLREDELAAVFCIVVHVYVDWYLRVTFLGIALTLVLLLILLMRRSSQKARSWPLAWGAWLVLLVLALFRTAYTPNFSYGADYYVNIFVLASLACWLGSVLAKDLASIRRLFIGLSIFGTLLAGHTLIQAITGHFLFLIPTYKSQISVISYFSPGSLGVHRPESFLLNADTNGNFLALMLFIPLGLLMTSTSSFAKGCYVASILLMIAALFLTYTTGALLAAGAGLLTFVILTRHTLFARFKQHRHHLQIVLAMLLTLLLLAVGFRSQLHLLYLHIINPAELATRVAAWQTGLAVINAHPLTGLGLGRDVYLIGSQPYRVPAQHLALEHPHNSYIELAALGGLPVVCLFVFVLAFSLWHASRTWTQADVFTRPILAGGIAAVVVLSCASLTNAGWTLEPLAMIGWLLLGVVSSPFLAQYRTGDSTKEGA